MQMRLLLSLYVPLVVKFIDPVQVSLWSITTNLLCINPSRWSPRIVIPASRICWISLLSMLSLSITIRTATPRWYAWISASRMLHRFRLYAAISTEMRALSIAAARASSGPPSKFAALDAPGSVKWISSQLGLGLTSGVTLLGVGRSGVAGIHADNITAIIRMIMIFCLCAVCGYVIQFPLCLELYDYTASRALSTQVPIN